MPKFSKNWGCCESHKGGEHIECAKCRKLFHQACLITGGNQPTDPVASWICPLCKMSKPKKGNNDNTPVRMSEGTSSTLNVTQRSKKRPAFSSPPDQSSTSSINHDDIYEVVKRVMQEELAEFKSNLKDYMSSIIMSEMKSIKEELKEVRDGMNFINDKYEDLINTSKSTSEVIKSLTLENSCLQSSVSDLKRRLNQMEQHARSANVEIQCVPEQKNENLITIVKKIGSTIGYKVDDSNIMLCTRVAKINHSSQRPRSIVTQFCSPKFRDSFMASIYNFNKSHSGDKLNSSHIGIVGEERAIFVMEHLSPSNKALHGAARLRAKQKGFKYVWVRNGRIFMRRDDTSECRIINSMDSLDKLN